MKALVYTKPNQMVYRDEPDPMPGPGEVIVRIDAVGICGSDMHGYRGHDSRRVPPLILGHEASGVVITGPEAGGRAVLNPLITCGICDDCLGGRSNLCRERKLIGMNRAGAFAEMIAIPERNLIAMPTDMDPVAAALTEPVAVAVHAVALAAKAMPRPLSELRTLVLGGGAIGLSAALVLHSQGCRDIMLGETNSLRRAGVERAGVSTVYDPANESGPESDSVDVVIDAVGLGATRKAAVAAVKSGGVIVHVGLMDASGELDIRKMTLSEITFIGTYTYTPIDLRAAVRALHTGALGDFSWVERRPLSAGAAAFTDLASGRAAAAKIVLLPN